MIWSGGNTKGYVKGCVVKRFSEDGALRLVAFRVQACMWWAFKRKKEGRVIFKSSEKARKVPKGRFL